MKNLSIKSLLLGLMFIPMLGISQLCYKTVDYCLYPKKDGYVFNGQSQSGAFLQGDTAEVTIVVYKDMEYRISGCCPQSEELNGKLQFQIVETVKEGQWKTYEVKEKVTVEEDGEEVEKTVTKQVKKRVFVKTPIVRYDGFKQKEASAFEMISSKTRKLTIKVYIPEVGGEGGQLEADDLACIGLLIEHRPAPKNIGKFTR